MAAMVLSTLCSALAPSMDEQNLMEAFAMHVGKHMVESGDGGACTAAPVSQEDADEPEDPPGLAESDSEDESDHLPAPPMPCTAKVEGDHRDKYPRGSLYNACVARPVKPAEVKINAKAKAAIGDEWDRL